MVHFGPALALALLWAKFSKHFLQPAFNNILRPVAKPDQAIYNKIFSNISLCAYHTLIALCNELEMFQKQHRPLRPRINPSANYDSVNHQNCQGASKQEMVFMFVELLLKDRSLMLPND